MTALLALDQPPDAVFAANDMMALGAMSVVRENGLRVPDDVRS
jgi:DNA-binding LacI/PurR family transcriptional regulator